MDVRTEVPLNTSIFTLGVEMGGMMRRSLQEKMHYSVFYKTSCSFEEMGIDDFSGSPISLCGSVIFHHFRKYTFEREES